ADVSPAPAGHPRAARRALGGVASGCGVPAEPARHPPGPPGDRSRRAARVQANDDPRVRNPVEQLRLRLPGVLRAAGNARREEGRSPVEVRVPAAPPLQRSGVHPECRPDSRNQCEPRVCRGFRGLPGRHLISVWHSRLNPYVISPTTGGSPMALTQTQLASEVADRSGLTKNDAKAALTALEEIVLEQLADAEKVRIGGVVQLVVRVTEATKPRQGRNPATGEEITIPAKPAS